MVRRKQNAPRRKLQWWEKLASLTKEQWAYANAFHQAEERAWQRKQCQCTSRRPPMQKKKTQKTKNLLDPEGTGTGLSRHCSASVFSSQTIDLQVVGESLPYQQTQSGPVTIKGP